MPITDDPTTTAHLDAVYDIETKDDARRLYDDWADAYAAEMAANGYAAPARTAEALAKFADDPAAPLLDLGCGVGLSGKALHKAGFACIDGTDLSPRMLEGARRTGIYRKLILGDLGAPLPAAPGAYANMTAIGVFSPGHAPASLIETALRLLPRGGCFAFTLNDHALKDRDYSCRLRELLDCGFGSLVFKERGPHLPGIGLEAEVWVVRRS